MRLILLFIGLYIADSMTVLGITPSDPEAQEFFYGLILFFAVYALILDLWKKV